MWKYIKNTTMAETTERGCANFIQRDVDDLGLVYMRGGTGGLPGQDVYCLAFISTFCRRDNEDLLLLDAILNVLYLHVNYCKNRIVSTILSRTRRNLYDKKRSAQAGIPIAETGISARRDATKNVPPGIIPSR